MTIGIEQYDLSWALKKAGVVIERSPALPVCNHVCIDPDPGSSEVMITATNLRVTVEVVVPCSCDEDESFVLPHKELTVLTAPEKKGAGGRVTLSDPPGAVDAWALLDKEVAAWYASRTVDKPGNHVPLCEPTIDPKWLVANVTAPGLVGTIQGMEHEVWPNYARDVEWGERQAVDRADFLAELVWVTLSMSVDEARPQLNMVQVKNGMMVCTDGHRLHRSLRQVTTSDMDLPGPCVAPLIKLLKGSKSVNLTITKGVSCEELKPPHSSANVPLEKQHDENWLSFTTGEGWTLIYKHKDERFPPWERIVPNVNGANITVTFDAAQLASTLRRIQKLEKGKPTTLEFKQGMVSVSACGINSTALFTVDVPAEIRGALDLTPPDTLDSGGQAQYISCYGESGGRIFLNGRFALEAFDKQDGPVTLRLTEPINAIRFDCDERMGVLMPMNGRP